MVGVQRRGNAESLSARAVLALVLHARQGAYTVEDTGGVIELKPGEAVVRPCTLLLCSVLELNLHSWVGY